MKIDGRCLFVWRHADAGEPLDEPAADYRRELSALGGEQARLAADWLHSCLPASYVLLSSPAPRAWQTASALGQAEAFGVLGPGSPAVALRRALGAVWPGQGGPVVLVGHQPQLGYFINGLTGPADSPLTIRKAGIWVLRYRADREPAVSVLAVRDPGFASARFSD